MENLLSAIKMISEWNDFEQVQDFMPNSSDSDHLEISQVELQILCS